jgi:hypothetical protein
MIASLTSETSSRNSSSGKKLFTTSFDEAEDAEDVACDWSFILESMHIAFMQQEALRFEQNSVPEGKFQAMKEHASRGRFEDEFDQ